MGGAPPPPPDTCDICKHYRGTRVIGETEIMEGDHIHVCRAFPGGIPDEIIDGEHDHKTKYPGQDNNILFEPI